MSNQRAGLSPVQWVLIILVVLAGLGGVGFLVKKILGEREQAKYVAQIGDHKVTSDQLKLRQAHANVYYPGSGTPEVALAQLIQGYLSAELMKKQGVTLDRTTWLAEEERIEKQTRDPATLAKVKYVYGDNHEDYLYVGILPDFAQSRIFRLYRSSPAFAEEARKTASDFLDKAEGNPASFMKLAEELGGHPRRMKADPRKGMMPAEQKSDDVPGGMKDAAPKSQQEMQLRAEMEAQAGERDIEAAKSLLERLAPLAPGQIYRNTLEAPESFETVRLVEKLPNGGAIVEMASFPKPDFGVWFWKEAGKIPVRIHNPGLKEQFVREVSWAKQLNLY